MAENFGRRKIKVDYLSRFWTSFNCRELEFIGYNDSPKEDGYTSKLRSVWTEEGHQVRDTAYLDDQSLAVMIQEDQIDILVDWAENSGNNRLRAFVHEALFHSKFCY